MTDSVDTDALRDLSAWLYSESASSKSELVSAAADEVDSLIDDVNSLRNDRDFMLRTIIELRGVIEFAPHDLTCPAKQGAHLICRCWKAQVL